MKKALLNTGSAFTRTLLMLVMALVSLSASAIEWKPLEMGTEYQAPAWDSEYYIYTATGNGIVTIVSSTGMSLGGVTITTEKSDTGVSGSDIGQHSYSSYTAPDGTSYSQRKQFSVTAGTTYYLLVPYTFSTSHKFTAYLDAEVRNLTLKSSNFTEGEVFDISDNRFGQLTLSFNLAADADDEATLTVPSKGLSAQIETHKGNSGSLSFILKDTLSSWLDQGKIVGGEEMTFTATGVKAKTDATILYGKDGKLTMSFLCPSKGHQMTASYVPSVIKSYYVKGNTEGILTFTFDADLATGDAQKAQATFRLGSADAGDVYVEELDSLISINGNTLSIDMTGHRRTYSDMGLKTQWSNVTIRLMYVTMADGTMAYTASQGSAGSYTFTASFTEVSGNVSAEWTPDDGSSIADVDNVKLYLSNKDAIQFTGVRFYYQDVTTDQYYQTIVTEGITSTAEGTTGIEYTIPVNATIKAAKNVRVSLYGQTAIDGNEHDITVKYNPGPELTDDFEPTAVSPASASTLTSLDKITLTFDEDVHLNTPTGTEQLIITDATTGKNVQGTIAVSETNAKQVVITPSEQLKNTHKYTVAVGHAVISNNQFVESAGKYGRFMKELDLTYTIYTASQSYDFDMDPLEGSTLNEISSIKITTKAGKSASTYGITATSNPDKSVWIENAQGTKVATAKIVDIVSESDDEPSGFYINFSPAITEAGQYKVVLEDSTYYVGEGNNAEPNNAKVYLAYTVVAAPAQTIVPTVITPASESTVESLEVIELNFDSFIYGVDTPVTALNQTTRESVTGTLFFPASEGGTTCYVNLSEAITSDGNWTITIPAGVIGDQTWWDSDLLSGNVNAQIMLYYTVGSGSGETANVTADPADKSSVTSLKTITLTFNDAATAGNGYTEDLATVTDAAGNVLQSFDCYKPEYGIGLNQMDVTLSEEITADGIYTISFPAGFFTLDDTKESPAFTLTYYIGDVDGIRAISGLADDAQQTIFTLGGQKVLKAAQKGIYIINGKKTVVK